MPTPGLFITGTDTGVGKTYVAALIAKQLAAGGHRVGVYKPAASGCTVEHGRAVSDDAMMLWNAAGKPGDFDRVCPQCFVASLAPHLAARAEGKELDAKLMRSGLNYWMARSDVVVVEGAGGLMSPLGDSEYVADLAADFGFPLVIVARNALGTINHTLQTVLVAQQRSLCIAGVVLNNPAPVAWEDASVATNRRELAARLSVPSGGLQSLARRGQVHVFGHRFPVEGTICSPKNGPDPDFAARLSVPVLAEVAWQDDCFDAAVDWIGATR